MRLAAKIIFPVSLVFFIGCGSAPKSADSSAASTGGAMATSVPEQATLQELSSASNVLKAVIAQAAQTKGSEDPGEQVLGCKLSGQRAHAMLETLRPILRQRIEIEATDYAQDPKVYAKNNGFETCGGDCHCGVLAMVVEQAKGERVTKIDTKAHQRFLTKLNAKAKLQTPEQTLSCARKQTSFCTSELMKYLEKSNPSTL